MKFFRLSIWAVLLASLALGGVGCKKGPKNVTQIPGNTYAGNKSDVTPRPPADLNRGNTLTDGNFPKANDSVVLPPIGPDGSIPLAPGFNRENFIPDREAFKSETIYFDFDRHAVKASERGKAESVATILRARPNTMVEIEGHCDERGTEEYNRALGERRALAIREYLINLGIAQERVHTISYGEDRPAEIGSNESAWAKNRRGEFILLTPRQ